MPFDWDPNDVQAWAAVVTAIILGLAALYTWRQVRQAARGHHAETLGDFHSRWDSWEMREVRLTVSQKTALEMLSLWNETRDSDSRDENRLHFELVMLTSFFESLGLARRHGSLPLKKIEDWIGPAVTHYWEKFALVATQLQGAGGAKSATFQGWQGLVKKLNRRRRRLELLNQLKPWG